MGKKLAAPKADAHSRIIQEKTIRKLPQHLRKWLREKKHQNIFKDEYKQIADDVKKRIEEKQEQEKQMEFSFT